MVQAYAYGKFLGHLTVNFTEDGGVESYSGDPIVLWGDDMEQDKETLEELAVYQEKVCQDFRNKV